MIPYMKFKTRVIAWILWKFEGFDSMDKAEFRILSHPSLLKTTSILREYFYIKQDRKLHKR
jgi:hypothetical protein